MPDAGTAVMAADASSVPIVCPRVCQRILTKRSDMALSSDNARNLTNEYHNFNLNFTMQLISGEKDWKHVSVQKVVTLNTCCDVACLTFQFSHITTGSFQSHECLEKRNITFSQMKVLHFTR